MQGSACRSRAATPLISWTPSLAQLNPSRVKYVRNRVLKVVSEANTDLTVALASKSTFSQDVDAVTFPGPELVLLGTRGG
jgi:hypothetical protein